MEAAVELGNGYILASFQRPIEHARNRKSAQVVAVVEIRDENLQWSCGIALGFRNSIKDRLEEWLEILARNFHVCGRCARLCVGVEHGKIELFLFRVKVNKEVINFVQDLLRACVGTVDLINDQNRGKMRFQRLTENIASLWQ